MKYCMAATNPGISTKRCIEMIFLVAGLLSVSNVVYIALNPQVSGGAVSGSVVDGGRASIPKVQLTFINTTSGVARAVATDDTGFYTVPDLQPGTYEMTVAAEGFTTQLRTGIVVEL